MDIQFMKDYYELRYEETDGENHFVDEAVYQEKQTEQSKIKRQSCRSLLMSVPKCRWAKARDMRVGRKSLI